MSENVLMPKELTAENGAKALLMGEFYSEVVQDCPDCEDGWEDIDSGEECHNCGGAGCYTMRVPVSWTTIKEIYRMAVDHLAIEPNSERG
jgi:hypothetical protein